jgi:D-tyrosyl-tRNA(Tyr) deacylase
MPPWQAEGMRAVVQRVLRASVDVITANGVERSGEIGSGLLALVGVTHDDDDSSADRLADRIANLRICDDEDGVMNRSVLDLGRSVLVVSQFTLYGDTSRGRRPGWSDAARPEVAEPLIERLVERLRAVDIPVATGRFRTEMRVELVNDGPVTVIVDV